MKNLTSMIIAELLEEDKPVSIEFKIKRDDDEEVLDIHLIARCDKKGGKIFGVIRDITEQKKISTLIQK